ncbi:MAG: glycine cleavage system aminomethyltransferase GcvT [bacterium]
MRTPLFDQHLAIGGRMVEFAGWEMPIQYSGILHEHKAVREACGVFDISHMGEFFVSGIGATAWLDGLLTNNLNALPLGHAQYTILLNERGGVIDDLIAYRLEEEKYFLIVNASKIPEDSAWLSQHAVPGVIFEDRSNDFAALAIQGPQAATVFEKLFQRPMPAERNRVEEIESGRSFIATTGYTGEAGFEWVMPANEATTAWQAALHAGATPCGLGARDTLRLEMCYPLNGSDLSPDRTPLEAGLGFFVDLKKPAFTGRDALLAQKASIFPHKLCALRVLDKAPPVRPHYKVYVNGEPVTETTSGALSPSLGYGIAMAYLPPAYSDIGQMVDIEVRDRRFRAQVVKKPFYKKP